MKDQTTELRNLTRRTQRGSSLHSPPPCVAALLGAREGVGVTTVAINLAVALTELGARVVVVDANLQRAELASSCGIHPQTGVADILTARRDVHEVLVAGPAGIHLLPGSRISGTAAISDDRGPQRLWRQIRALGRHAEVVLIDMGPSMGPRIPEIWKATDLGLLVTTPDNASVMATYAAIKHEVEGERRLHLIVNQADNDQRGEDVHRRLATTCQQFLKRDLQLLGSIPHDTSLGARPMSPQPLVLEAPESSVALAIGKLAEHLQPHLDHQLRRSVATPS